MSRSPGMVLTCTANRLPLCCFPFLESMPRHIVGEPIVTEQDLNALIFVPIKDQAPLMETGKQKGRREEGLQCLHVRQHR